MSPRSTRSPLRLVAPDERVSPGEPRHPGDRLPAGYLVSVTSRQAIRLTRRGRLVITLMVTLAIAALALALATSVSAADSQIDHATTVSAGQTLSEVAASQLPALPINDAVARIQLANGLNTLQVHAGQALLIPAWP
jgi:hypothetical protein